MFFILDQVVMHVASIYIIGGLLEIVIGLVWLLYVFIFTSTTLEFEVNDTHHATLAFELLLLLLL